MARSNQGDVALQALLFFIVYNSTVMFTRQTDGTDLVYRAITLDGFRDFRLIANQSFGTSEKKNIYVA